MDRALRQAVQAALAQADLRRTGGGAEGAGDDGGDGSGGVEIVADRPVSGGCIHDSRLVELADGRRFFVKSDAHAAPDVFEREAEGLAALAAPDAIRVPRHPVAGRADTGGGGGVPFLVMEAIPTGRPGPGFWDDFGRRFAELHRRTARDGSDGEPRFGFPHDNYLGGTPQPNPWSDDWVAFFAEHRLAHQLRLARQRGRATGELSRLGQRLVDRLGEYVDLPEEPGCLLHGDLWSGNYLADDGGGPVLIDPAAYHGHREADLAMTELFGRFDDRFYAAYEEAWPLPPGSRDRIRLYQLYHLLNHLNLFGSSYLSGCLSILRRYAG